MKNIILGKVLKRVALGTSVLLVGSALAACGNEAGVGVSNGSIAADESSALAGFFEGTDKVIKLDISDHQTFNDTDGDGFGEFQGWGTSLCWWANRVGYSKELTDSAAAAFFDRDRGLGLNIGRYNIGGGDYVTDIPLEEIENPGDFLHSAHIQRSDSIVPGYAVDVTRIDLEKETKEYYTENFARADFDCGYAWNYDWNADTNQLNVLKAAAEYAKDDFIAEAFSNSPPYFMTVSGCSSGNKKAAVDNLREDSYNAFACYMADVMEHLEDSGIIEFESVSPMNEPATNYWSAFSNKQEGCHFSPGKSQSGIIEALGKELKRRGMNVLVSGTDETSINTAISSFNKLSDEAKETIYRIDTHSYDGDKRDKLKQTALLADKNLWMSEVDGTYSLGKESGAMEAALGFADAIMRDVNGMYPSAWIMWNAADMHIDTANVFDTLSRDEAESILTTGEPFWGIAIADHDAGELLVGKKYYGFGQFTRYIRPGYCIVKSGENTLAAYDPKSGKVVIVVMNPDKEDKTLGFELGDFGNEIVGIKAVRTLGEVSDITRIETDAAGGISGEEGAASLEAAGENWADVSDADDIATEGAAFSAVAKGYSITTYIVDMK